MMPLFSDCILSTVSGFPSPATLLFAFSRRLSYSVLLVWRRGSGVLVIFFERLSSVPSVFHYIFTSSSIIPWCCQFLSVLRILQCSMGFFFTIPAKPPPPISPNYEPAFQCLSQILWGDLIFSVFSLIFFVLIALCCFENYLNVIFEGSLHEGCRIKCVCCVLSHYIYLWIILSLDMFYLENLNKLQY